MWFYFFLVIALLLQAVVLFAALSQKTAAKIYLWVSFVELTLLSGLRAASVGTDTQTYVNLFHYIGTNSLHTSFTTTRYEKGYILLNKLLYQLGGNSQVLLFISSAFVLAMAMYFIYKESEITWMSVFLFITLTYFYFMMVDIRLSIAAGIVLISYQFLKRRKLIPFVLLVFLATLFHSSALVFLLIYPCVYLKFNRKWVLVFISVGMLAFVAFSPALSLAVKVFPQYQHYTEGSQYFVANRLANYVYSIIQIVILVFGSLITNSRAKERQLEGIDDIQEEIQNMDLLKYITLFGVIFTTLAIRGSIIDRMSLYFSMFNIIFIPNVLSQVKNSKSYSFTVGIYLTTVGALLYNGVIFLFRPDWYVVFPYHFFWHHLG